MHLPDLLHYSNHQDEWLNFPNMCTAGLARLDLHHGEGQTQCW